MTGSHQPGHGTPEPTVLLELGRITKAHGLRGEVVVFLTSDRPERVARGSVLITDRNSTLVVESSRAHQDRWIVKFESLGSREAAEAARGTVLSGEPLEDPDALWVHELIGCTVVTPDGVERGTIESVMDNPASDLLVLDNGSLVPVAFVVGVPQDRIVAVDTPEGLFDLND